MAASFTLVTQSFGRENEYRRVIFAILSFYAVSDHKVPTILFTDRPEYFEQYFEGLPVRYILLTPEKIKVMRGEIDFLHRMKIALIEEALEVSGTNMLYADSDTFFLSDPAKYTGLISETQSFMHIHEYQFEEVREMALPAGRAARAFVQYIEDNIVLVPGTDIRIDAQMSSWNAGVILIDRMNKKLVDKVYQLTDSFFPACGSHASEQYAFSIILQTITDVKPVDDVIYHYWYNIKKKIIDEFLTHKLDKIAGKSIDEKMAFVRHSVKILPDLFDNHIDSLKDNAIQAFNDFKYKDGLRSSLKAFTKGALADTQFIKDFLYHTKMKIFGKKNEQ